MKGSKIIYIFQSMIKEKTTKNEIQDNYNNLILQDIQV